MLGELNNDIIGTNPKYPPIADLRYLTVDLGTYDNYPSDNNSVRIQPKLSDLWNPHKCENNINLIPNQTIQSSTERPVDLDAIKAEIIRETKKAMMMGLYGKELTAHLRARFDGQYFSELKEEMGKLAQEQGLLGNIYIDATAFSSLKDAEQFLTKYRNRLAQDFLVDEKAPNYLVMSFLANKYRKNVVSKIAYDEKLFKKYKAYLVDAGMIDNDYKIDSKESLRKAFIDPPVKEKIVSAKASQVKEPTSKEQIEGELKQRQSNQMEMDRLAAEDILFKRVFSVIKFARENFSKGKRGENLKGMLRGKFASSDLRDAHKYLAIVLSEKIIPQHVDKLVENKRVSKKIGTELKSLLNEYPLKLQSKDKGTVVERQIGVPGYFHISSDQGYKFSQMVEAAVSFLRKGKTLENVKEEVLKMEKLSRDDLEYVLMTSVKKFNESPAGIKANEFVPEPKKKVVADIEEKEVLPDPRTIMPQTKEFLDFYKGAELEVDVGSCPILASIDIKGLDSKSGLDSVL